MIFPSGVLYLYLVVSSLKGGADTLESRGKQRTVCRKRKLASEGAFTGRGVTLTPVSGWVNDWATCWAFTDLLNVYVLE